MKKYFSILLVCLVALGIAFVGCDNSTSSSSSNGGGSNSAKMAKLAAGTGKWENDSDTTMTVAGYK